METSATQSAAQILQPRTSEPSTSREQIDAFTRVLFGGNTQTPEHRAIEHFQLASRKVDHALVPARDGPQALSNPLDMLAAQTTMLRSIIEVDLMAKTAGAISQGVNKLVNVQ
ncbi:type III secretion system inner rod subunit SctI [Burkholderia ubonensis]|uniref:type III secretion system inner rod subunit SctI n=1 Tax=Burkholderia ubonensis TaxID=101571 RepID=UPI000752EA2A|nr:type III secretion system inner rod subunit SctI [Burkholderia ubonensis]KVX77017.1 type III secretion system protein [Burkholderia ubonensis]